MFGGWEPSHRPVGLLARLGQGPNEVVPVHVVQEDVLTLVPAAHDVIHRPGYSGRSLRGMIEA